MSWYGALPYLSARGILPPMSSELAEGVIIGETYQLTTSLGTGGYSSVWGAKHLRLPGKQVAIKFLHLHRMLSEETLARFRREAEITSRLAHANIVQVFDVNSTTEGIPYIVLEYLEGESLASCIARGPMDLAQTCTIIGEVASALDAAHALKIIHRDLKPDNIFLLPEPLTKVLDFGISKVLDSTTVQTQEDALLGTPRYMSPEQAGGLPEDIDATTDVFALGSIAYEMLSGHYAFEGEKLAGVVYKVMCEEPRPLGQARPDLSSAVILAIQGALTKDKKERFASATEFAEALSVAAGIAGAAEPSASVSVAQSTPIPGSKWKVGWLAALLAGVGVTAMLVHFGLGGSDPAPGPASTDAAATASDDAALATPDAMPADAMPADAMPADARPPDAGSQPVKPLPAPGPPSSSEAKTLIKKARSALTSGDTKAVRALIQQLHRLKATSPAHLLEGQLACKERNLSRANALRRRLPSAKKRALEAYCRQQDFALPPR